MTKTKVLLFLALLMALPMHADRRKKRTSAKPDVIVAQPIENPIASTTEIDTLYTDSLQKDSTTVYRHNVNIVPLQDTASWIGRVQHQLDSLCNTSIFETTQLGLYVYDITAETDIFAVNHLHRMRPASCQKLVTSITALECLGGNYQFATTVHLTGEVKDSVLMGDVYVVGGMDPLLSQGDVYQMAQALLAEGIDSIAGHLYTDLSFKDQNDYGWGWCWDDKLEPLRALTVDEKDCFGDELLANLSDVGIRLAFNEVTVGTCPSNARLVHQKQHSIDQVLMRMMKNSHNIFAESMFYQLAAIGGQREAGRKQAVKHVNSLISKLGLKANRYQIADGSGLSLYNYLTPQLLVRLLTYAWHQDDIRKHLYPSLPVAGIDGTLAKRMTKTLAQDNVHAKTGTVDGVSSLSGYATSPEGHILCFSIINQGIRYSSTGKGFQDKVCRILCETGVSQNPKDELAQK